MRRIASVPLPLAFAPFSEAPHYFPISLNDGGLAILRRFSGDIEILSSSFKIAATVRFRPGDRTIPRNIESSAAVLRPHCIVQDAEGNLVVFDPAQKRLMVLSLAGQCLDSRPFPHAIISLARRKNQVLALCAASNRMLFICDLNGKRRRGSFPTLPFLEAQGNTGKLLLFGDNWDCVMVNSASGRVVFRDSKSRSKLLSLGVKNRQASTVAQLAALDVGGHPSLMITWPGLPRGALGLFPTRDGEACVLTGTGRHFFVLDKDFASIRYFEIPLIQRLNPAAVFVEFRGDGLMVGTRRGDLWMVNYSEIREITKEEFSLAVNPQIAAIEGSAIGPKNCHIIAEEDIPRLIEALGNASGIFEFDVELNRDSRATSVSPVDFPDSSSKSERKASDSIVDALRGARYITENRDLLGRPVRLRVLIGIWPPETDPNDARVMVVS